MALVQMIYLNNDPAFAGLAINIRTDWRGSLLNINNVLLQSPSSCSA